MEQLGKHVSYSEISSYMECPTKHHYAYVERLHRTRFSQSNKVDIGIITHEALEAALKAYHTNYNLSFEEIDLVVDAKVDAYSDEHKPVQFGVTDEGYEFDNTDLIAEWMETVNVARQIAKRTIKHLDVPNNWRTQTLMWEGVETPLIEFRFEYPLVEDRNIVGKLDWVARNVHDNQVYLIDWKTRKAFTDDFEIAGEDMNLQISLYQYVLNSMGIETFQTITYQIRSTIPSIPEVNKGRTLKDGTVIPGHVSKAKIATDYETYMKALVDNNEDIEEYQEFLDNIQPESYWFSPIYISRGKQELLSRWRTAQMIVKRMMEDTEPPKYESPRCMYCPFFRLCLGEDRGLDVQTLKDLSYTISERKR